MTQQNNYIITQRDKLEYKNIILTHSKKTMYGFKTRSTFFGDTEWPEVKIPEKVYEFSTLAHVPRDLHFLADLIVSLDPPRIIKDKLSV